MFHVVSGFANRKIDFGQNLPIFWSNLPFLTFKCELLHFKGSAKKNIDGNLKNTYVSQFLFEKQGNAKIFQYKNTSLCNQKFMFCDW